MTVMTWVSTVAGDQGDGGCKAEPLVVPPEQHSGDALWLRGAEPHSIADREHCRRAVTTARPQPPVAEKDQGEDEVSAYVLTESGAGGAV